jgi:UDP-N-acetylmuramoylalanine--D-glutamate ligase
MNIAIAGFGIEGRASYAYYKNLGHVMTIADESDTVEDLPEGVPVILGEGAFSKLQEFDLVLRSPAINPNRIATNGKIWSATNEFFEKCPAPIVGVTGSKGKGTTCSLVASILRAAGRTVHLVGNIGVPALSELSNITADDIVVYELSSFQLWDAERSPHVAVIVHMEPDHLEVHADMNEYIHAKANIRTHQTQDDVCFYLPNNQYVQQIIDMPASYEQDSFQSRDWRWRAFQYGVKNERDQSVGVAYLDKEIFCIQRPEQEGISTVHTSALQLPGKHNQMNACAAISAALVFGADDTAIEQGLRSFTGLPHRLKLVRELNGVTYYDDSVATTPGSSIGAMRAFVQPKIMILGGSSKGADFKELASVAQDSGVKCVIAIGDEGTRIEQALAPHNVLTFNMGKDVTMNEILAVVQSRVEPGDVVILSPACASFDMFRSYTDRGDQFIAAVNALG